MSRHTPGYPRLGRNISAKLSACGTTPLATTTTDHIYGLVESLCPP
ncbi:hypothetical protein I553_10501 [Mycobacterium xenopi 4042]|uniref:Uncharacterized protein n=1 Tax=Mycobacterium xenopi 4042 TaxID=1299334 RepID=X8DJ07_MYCXE|nr:hypothetical protein I552_3590 [Mycobacterium xenopi 3993]EUA68349.1 hypothetical protein I553_10501 [Mycobacterium xenopi 4042]